MSAVDLYKQRVMEAMKAGDLNGLKGILGEIAEDQRNLDDVSENVKGLVKQLQYFATEAEAAPTKAAKAPAKAAPKPPARPKAPEPAPEPEPAKELDIDLDLIVGGEATASDDFDLGFLDEEPAGGKQDDDLDFDF